MLSNFARPVIKIRQSYNWKNVLFCFVLRQEQQGRWLRKQFQGRPALVQGRAKLKDVNFKIIPASETVDTQNICVDQKWSLYDIVTSRQYSGDQLYIVHRNTYVQRMQSVIYVYKVIICFRNRQWLRSGAFFRRKAVFLLPMTCCRGSSKTFGVGSGQSTTYIKAGRKQLL